MKMGRHNKSTAGSSPAEAAVCMLADRLGKREQRGDGDPTMHRWAGEGGEVLLCRTVGTGDLAGVTAGQRGQVPRGLTEPMTSQGTWWAARGREGRREMTRAHGRGERQWHFSTSTCFIPYSRPSALGLSTLACICKAQVGSGLQLHSPVWLPHKHNWTALVEPRMPTTPGQGHGHIHGQVTDTEALQGLQMHRETRSTHMENEWLTQMYVKNQML